MEKEGLEKQDIDRTDQIIGEIDKFDNDFEELWRSIKEMSSDEEMGSEEAVAKYDDLVKIGFDEFMNEEERGEIPSSIQFKRKEVEKSSPKEDIGYTEKPTTRLSQRKKHRSSEEEKRGIEVDKENGFIQEISRTDQYLPYMKKDVVIGNSSKELFSEFVESEIEDYGKFLKSKETNFKEKKWENPSSSKDPEYIGEPSTEPSQTKQYRTFGTNFADVDDPEKSKRGDIFNPDGYS